MNLSTIFLLPVLLHLSMMVSGQQVEYFKFYSRVSFMPGGGFKKETYEKKQYRLFHFSESFSYKQLKKNFKTKLPTDHAFNLEIRELDSLLKLNTFTFPMGSFLIDSIKTDTKAKKYYQLQDLDIDNFFEKKKSIQYL